MQQGIQPVQPQRRAEKAGEHLPPRNRHQQRFAAGRAVCQHFFHQRFAAQGQRFRVRRGGKVHAAITEPPAQLPQAHGGIGPGQVHFIDKNKRGYAVTCQQLPQRFGVGLHAVGAADDQHRVIQHLQSTLRFG